LKGDRKSILKSQQFDNLPQVANSSGMLQSGKSEAIRKYQIARRAKNVDNRKNVPFENPYSKYKPIPLHHDN
jgi:hypothetical protein